MSTTEQEKEQGQEKHSIIIANKENMPIRYGPLTFKEKRRMLTLYALKYIGYMIPLLIIEFFIYQLAIGSNSLGFYNYIPIIIGLGCIVYYLLNSVNRKKKKELLEDEANYAKKYESRIGGF